MGSLGLKKKHPDLMVAAAALGKKLKPWEKKLLALWLQRP
jgi:aminoglycoside phosphotransferase